ncbi:uncharacterized protein TNCV_3716511 [Trichonephila clavipes]|nr:uncharacterized protein TNCV_3716511 [Trichonephila clavipes]
MVHIGEYHASFGDYVGQRKGDTLYVECKTVLVSENLSKREVLSLTQALFDPLGFLTPVLLTAKLLLQEMWACGVGWDTPLTENVKRKFLKWYNGLEVLNELRIPRRMGFRDRNFWLLHVLCDASQHAYATVVFLQCETNEENLVSFVAASSRVAPLNGITIPRLELRGCVLGVRLSKYVTQARALHGILKYFWTNSTTAIF